ncbi:methyltransferase [Actinomycetospora lutea]|uniref:methyltransferase n=1 Tax=Actinomycetospora lutea TaxID=663604 RepID=UPI0023662E5F|nr:methyltransferase [Actinomycetospora lutea]MDD7938999.1 methyltransferase [Actinomycetospora lutea]
MSEVTSQEYLDLLGIVRGYERSRAVTVAAQLGVADLLRDGPRDVASLAAATGSHGPTLYRLLRALAAIGVFAEDDDGRFALTAMGEYLRRDHPLSVDPAARMFGADDEWRAWGDLPHTVRTGETAAEHALGMDVWEYRRQHPEQGELFDAAMRTFSRADSARLVVGHDFGRYGCLADVGGGTGAVLAAVLAAYPGVRGVLADQEHVVAGAPAVLHDWPDDDAVRILHTARDALGPEGRVLVVDAVVGPPGEDPLTKFLDLMMLVSNGGRERTAPEWRVVFERAGLRLVDTVPVGATRHLMEAVAV